MDNITHNLDGIVEGVDHNKRLGGEVFFTKNDRNFVVNMNGLFEIVGVNQDYSYINLGELEYNRNLENALNEAISKLEIVTTALRQEQADKVELRQCYENIIRSRDGLPVVKYTQPD